MRFAFLLLAVTTVFLSSPDVVGAKESKVSEAGHQPNSIDASGAKRFLRSNKWIDDDSTDYAEKEERGATATMTDVVLKLDHWLKKGKSPGMVRKIKLPKAGYTGTRLDELADQYADAYRAMYSTFKGQ
ncbi:hypothetical protein F441_10529 [Phytophthora nicotianae CJ01A1]|uniref:RxLR effector protein n=3 Tax=Phytophthora nicotianae TaxID=4792 RepID=V9EZK2_PHYNI|nr:hypothetical protein F443_10587 [Phytophthora nicotianae P1569]ETK84720.1 hypothetical protein L915_10345 [Phytophthora nicotianae]ETL38150.1 hypothetical protein L916_10245 [Phytophthora nicotianae]ETM44575.1 hypothetical protein L914_10206 [Phytophthora nicotianae]ETP14521.1 hypothetical protein F441_10529 [Phytophthora nicotianae CJ01A1]